MATEYSCVQCGSDMPEKDILVCDTCIQVIELLHKVELQVSRRPDDVFFRGRCKACGVISPWYRVAGVAHGWEAIHAIEVVKRLHDKFFAV